MDTFMFTVTGNAMEPEYYDGDRVQVQRTQDLDFGDVGIFLIGTEMVMREYGPGGLYAKNPNYPLLPTEGVQIVGRVEK